MLERLSVSNFRNFRQLDLNLHSKCSVIYGLNGTGKTSALEAIYFLFLGKSFRTRLIKNLIAHGYDSFQIGAALRVEDEEIKVGTLRKQDGYAQLKKNGNKLNSQREITKLLPVQLFNHESFLLLTDPAKIRRKFIDWGVFHLKPDFLMLWHAFERILKQRNEQIRQTFNPLWDKDLAKLGEQLHLMRLEYLKDFIPFAIELMRELLPGITLQLEYFPGWDVKVPGLEMLRLHRRLDIKVGYTVYGAHRADLLILVNDRPAKDFLSRGQQKILVYGLQLAQGLFLQHHHQQQKCLYLVDDPLAELDLPNYQLLMGKMYNIINSQIILTGLRQGDVKCLTSCLDGSYTEYDLSDSNVVEI